jgi:hypothetical protein
MFLPDIVAVKTGSRAPGHGPGAAGGLPLVARRDKLGNLVC